jgi:cyclopropane fatty-acyl-phospholipid synthase-like methyltransferase
MSETQPAGARSSPATLRNREPLLAVLQRWLPAEARVLEVASGAGEHAVFFAGAMPGVTWRPTDPDLDARASIAAWRASAGLPNLAAPIALDAANPRSWPSDPVDAIVCINMLHIAPWAAAEGLMAGAGGLLPAGGQLILYGPYLEADTPAAPSNLAFDADLKARNPAWGLRRLDDVAALARRHGLALAERVAMPANNLSLRFVKGGA